MDTQSLEDETGCGKLADFVPLTNYRYDMAATVVIFVCVLNKKFSLFAFVELLKLINCAFTIGLVKSLKGTPWISKRNLLMMIFKQISRIDILSTTKKGLQVGMDWSSAVDRILYVTCH